ncbi:beta-barrel assembly-enhancing protease [Gammaproteobacteria bacterium]
MKINSYLTTLAIWIAIVLTLGVLALNYPLLLLLVSTPFGSSVAIADPLDLNLPIIGESAGRYLSPEEDRRLGEAFMRNLRRSISFVDDSIVTDYLHSLGYQIVANADTPIQSFDFFAVDDPTINAFAGPGGHIGINTGLLLATDSEHELAAVIAHEVAHVSQHHIARSIEMGDRMSIPTIAAMLAAIVIASQTGQAGEAAIAAAAAGSTQMQINFLRGNEQEADRVGIQSLQRAGFDPRAMAGFFEHLQKSARYDVGTLPEFLRDHPVTESRITDARNRAEQFSYRQRADSLAYHLVRARLKIRALPSPAQGVQELKHSLDNGSYRNAAATHYAYALALLANHDPQAARVEVARLLTADPERIPYLITQADIELATGNTAAALTVYGQAQRLYPNNLSVTVNETRTLLQAKRPKEARDLLQGFMRDRSPNPAWYKLLAQAEGEVGNTPASREAVAEYLYLTGETRTAAYELRKALALPNLDFYTGSRIEARIKVLDEELAAEKERTKGGWGN